MDTFTSLLLIPMIASKFQQSIAGFTSIVDDARCLVSNDFCKG